MSDIPKEDGHGDSPIERDLSRRELLKKAGQIGAGAVAAGSLIGSAKAAPAQRPGATPKRGGKVTWALERDPVHLAPFGATLTEGHWGKSPMYESFIEWDQSLNERPALAESYKIVDKKTVDFTLRKGVKFHNGKELTAADAKYSFELMENPPSPGSAVVKLTNYAAVEGTEVRSKYVLRVKLKNSDARLFGHLAWNRYTPMVPEGLYQQVNVGREGIGTGPFRLLEFQPNSHVEYTRHQRYWKKERPYLDALSFKVLPDEQARIAALRAGAIDGGTFSADSVAVLARDRNLRVLKGPTAAFRELQMTIKPGDAKPWHDKRVRQAVNFAINRQEIIDKVYGGNGLYSGHVPPGYGPWPLSQAELKTKYEKFDLAKAKSLMTAAGMGRGFSVTMSTFSAPLDFAQISAVIKQQLQRININVNIETQEGGTFGSNNARGTFEWDLTQRGMRGDVDGYLSEFNPSNPSYNAWYPNYRNVRVWRLVGNGKIQLDQAKRLPMYKQAQRLLLEDLVQVPLIATTKFHVVRPRLQGMYVAFSDFLTGLHTSAWVNG